MKKLVLPMAMAFMMSPMLNASTAEMETVSWECHEIASAGADAAQGGDAAKFEVYEAVYQECLD